METRIKFLVNSEIIEEHKRQLDRYAYWFSFLRAYKFYVSAFQILGLRESRGEGTDKQTHGYKQRDSEKDKDRERETEKVYKGRGQCMYSSDILKEER